MLAQSQTAVLERNKIFSGDFVTEPFEVAWAREGRFFVRTLAREGRATLEMHPEISPDGLTWVDLAGAEYPVGNVALASWPIREFGHWIRLRAVFLGEPTTVKLIIYLALKG